jgi:hypothetical protein
MRGLALRAAMEGIIFALFLLVLSSLEIARLESKDRQAGCRAYLTRNRSITTVFVKARGVLTRIYYARPWWGRRS